MNVALPAKKIITLWSARLKILPGEVREEKVIRDQHHERRQNRFLNHAVLKLEVNELLRRAAVQDNGHEQRGQD